MRISTRLSCRISCDHPGDSLIDEKNLRLEFLCCLGSAQEILRTVRIAFFESESRIACRFKFGLGFVEGDEPSGKDPRIESDCFG
jgi:hypothetical protein